jgi:dolichyl-phosphate-mannose--protein O-mannosyl transferase
MKKFFSLFTPPYSMPVFHPIHAQWGLVFLLWVLGILLYLPKNDYPRAIVFDETYLIPNAQSYINGVFFQDSHPPLGRLFIALGQFLRHPQDPSNEFVHVSRIEEDWPKDIEISGYRLFPAIFGTINPLLVFGIVMILTKNEWVSLFSGLAVLLDNALLTQSRYALTDSILIAFCLGAILCFVLLQASHVPPGNRERTIWIVFGALAGAAFMVKFTGLFVLAVVPFYLYKLWRTGNRVKTVEFLLLAGLAFLLVFILVWKIHFSLLRFPPLTFDQPITEAHVKIVEGIYRPDPFQRFWIELTDAYRYMFEYHKNVPALDLSKPDEIGSPWYFWPFGGRTISYRWESGSGHLRIIYLLGNPVTWFISLLGVIAASATVIADALFKFLHPGQRQRLYPFVCLYWIYMIPVMWISRVMYLYHYLPPLVIGIILFGILFVDILSIPQNIKPRILFATILCIAVLFWLYSPFTYYKEISYEHFDRLNIWPVWDLQCPNC